MWGVKVQSGDVGDEERIPLARLSWVKGGRSHRVGAMAERDWAMR